MLRGPLPLHSNAYGIWMLSFMAKVQLLQQVSVLQRVCNYHFDRDLDSPAVGCKTFPIEQKEIFASDCFGYDCEGCFPAFLFLPE